MYYPQSPYDFSVVDANILGEIYDQFLGREIIFHQEHGVQIVEKPEVVASSGVVPTPKYIVDEIVKKTLDLRFKDLSVEDAKKIRVCDLCCGSGVFLVSAFDYIVNWHIQEYVSQGAANFPLSIYQDSGLLWRLTIVEKQKISQEESNAIFGNIQFVSDKAAFKNCSLIIEAIIENLDVKKSVFKELESIVSENCILASNTSSLSITSIASACKLPQRVIGIHFFNPAPLMPLVEIIPGIATDNKLGEICKQLITSWKKVPVICKDTPGFIVNRIARPYYGEAMRMYEEGIADIATIDWAMKTIGGFKMGPFEVTDMIGHDVSYTGTETV